MKQNRGKYWLLFLLLAVVIRAEDFTYNLSISKQNAYLHEPLKLIMDINQTNPNVILLFKFSIQQSNDYKVNIILNKHDENFHHIVYEIYPLKVGESTLKFSFTKRVTDEAKVRYFSSGDRDDFKKLETVDSSIDIPTIPLHIKALPKGTQLVGDFSLKYTFKTHHAKAYETLPLLVTFKGKGYPPLLDNILPKDINVTLFTDKPAHDINITEQGTYSTVTYAISLSHDKDFHLPNIKFKAFSPTTQKPYILTIPEQNFKITPVKVSNLVDTIDSPSPLKVNWSWLQNALTYFIIFFAGYFSALSLKWKRNIGKKEKQTNKQKVMKEKIENVEDSRALLGLLMSIDSHRFSGCITTLENSLYGDGKMNLKKVKKEAIELLCMKK